MIQTEIRSYTFITTETLNQYNFSKTVGEVYKLTRSMVPYIFCYKVLFTEQYSTQYEICTAHSKTGIFHIMCCVLYITLSVNNELLL